MGAEEHIRSSGLRVLMVSQRMLPYVAGAEIKLVGLAKAFMAAGAIVRIVTTKYARGLAGHDDIEGVSVRRLSVLRAPEAHTFMRVFEPVVKFAQFISMAFYVAAHGRQFDIIYANCLSSSSLGAILGARLCGRPILVEPSLGGADGELRKLTRSFASRFVIRLLKAADRFAVNNPLIADELIELGIDEQRIDRVKNGVDLERFHPTDDKTQARSKLRLPEGRIALFVGQLIERKGVRQLLEAWREVAAALDDAYLVFAGAGSEAENIIREAARPKSRILFLGVRNDAAELMRAADILVLPSRNESFANVLIESMASGLPFITGRTGIASQIAVDQLAGRVVDAAEPAQIASALREILDSPDLRAELGRRGRVAAEQYDIRQVAREYLTIYNSMTGGRQNEPERNRIEDYKPINDSKPQ